MADQLPPDPGPSSSPADVPSPWVVWLTLAWILGVLLALAAVAFGLENLELALDFQRHLG